MGRDTVRSLAIGRVARQATTRPGRRATRRGTPATLPVLGLRHGTLRATTRRSACVAWAQCAQPGPIVRTARVRWVCISAPNPVLDSVHCSESLFMNTVHKIFQKKK